MKHLHSSIRLAFAFASLLICCCAAQAQTRTFVSGLGSDANPSGTLSQRRGQKRIRKL